MKRRFMAAAAASVLACTACAATKVLLESDYLSLGDYTLHQRGIFLTCSHQSIDGKGRRYDDRRIIP